MTKPEDTTAEQLRLRQQETGEADWRQWGPYLSDRAWGTVREDYSPDGNAWEWFPHDHARSKAYRWNEDGLAGVSDSRQYLCLALALWNGNDPILKERLFGLTGPEGNHGEDVKEEYFHVDATPSHSYLHFRYLYPQSAFPYQDLVEVNRRRGAAEPEFELADTGVFDEGRYFDVHTIYAKEAPDDLLVAIRVTNRGPAPAQCHVLPTIWFRNTWSWGYRSGPMGDVASAPILVREDSSNGPATVRAEHPVLGTYRLWARGAEELWFTGNETNRLMLGDTPENSRHVKDAFHRALIEDERTAVNPAERGTKATAIYRFDLAPDETATVRLRLAASVSNEPFAGFDEAVEQRRLEADEFYATLQPANLSPAEREVHRRAVAGMIWSSSSTTTTSTSGSTAIQPNPCRLRTATGPETTNGGT